MNENVSNLLADAFSQIDELKELHPETENLLDLLNLTVTKIAGEIFFLKYAAIKKKEEK